MSSTTTATTMAGRERLRSRGPGTILQPCFSLRRSLLGVPHPPARPTTTQAAGSCTLFMPRSPKSGPASDGPPSPSPSSSATAPSRRAWPSEQLGPPSPHGRRKRLSIGRTRDLGSLLSAKTPSHATRGTEAAPVGEGVPDAAPVIGWASQWPSSTASDARV